MSLKKIIDKGFDLFASEGVKAIKKEVDALPIHETLTVLTGFFLTDNLIIEIHDKGYAVYKKSGMDEMAEIIDGYNLSIDQGNQIMEANLEGVTLDDASKQLLGFKDNDYQMAESFKTIMKKFESFEITDPSKTGPMPSGSPVPGPTGDMDAGRRVGGLDWGNNPKLR